MNLRDLQKEAHAIAKAEHWYGPVTWLGEPLERSFYEQIERIHSAISKLGDAFQAIGSGDWTATGGDDVSAAFANVVIRIADMAEFYGKDLERALWRVHQRRRHKGPLLDLYLKTKRSQFTFGGWVLGCHQRLNDVCVKSDIPGGLDHQLVLFLSMLQVMANHHEIDLDAAVEARMDYMSVGR